jgi:hypothetical protein
MTLRSGVSVRRLICLIAVLCLAARGQDTPAPLPPAVAIPAADATDAAAIYALLLPAQDTGKVNVFDRTTSVEGGTGPCVFEGAPSEGSTERFWMQRYGAYQHPSAFFAKFLKDPGSPAELKQTVNDLVATFVANCREEWILRPLPFNHAGVVPISVAEYKDLADAPARAAAKAKADADAKAAADRAAEEAAYQERLKAYEAAKAQEDLLQQQEKSLRALDARATILLAQHPSRPTCAPRRLLTAEQVLAPDADLACVSLLQRPPRIRGLLLPPTRPIVVQTFTTVAHPVGGYNDCSPKPPVTSAQVSRIFFSPDRRYALVYASVTEQGSCSSASRWYVFERKKDGWGTVLAADPDGSWSGGPDTDASSRSPAASNPL